MSSTLLGQCSISRAERPDRPAAGLEGARSKLGCRSHSRQKLLSTRERKLPMWEGLQDSRSNVKKKKIPRIKMNLYSSLITLGSS
jgi:hypothetical protein